MIRGWSGSLRGVTAFLFAGALLTGAAVTAFAQAAQTFNVRLSNFMIAGAPAQVRAGAPLAFNATAMGFPHNLAIDGNGVDLRPSTPNLMETSGTVTFAALQPGTYTLYCPVGMHRANGMQVSFTVVAGAANLPVSGGGLRLPLTGGFGLSGGLALAGLASAAAGTFMRRRSR
jgi:plastocyanin